MVDTTARAMASDAIDRTENVEKRINYLPNGIQFKGGVATFEDLPRSANYGDTYLVISDSAKFTWGPVDGVDQWIYYTSEGLADVAYSGRYEDLLTKLEAGNNITITGNVISATASNLPAYPTYDANKQYALCLVPNQGSWALNWKEITVMPTGAIVGQAIVGTAQI